MSEHRFSITQGKAVTDTRVSHAQFRTLAALGMYADKNGWCWPSQTTVAKDLGKGRQTVNEDIAALVVYGYVEKKWFGDQLKYRLIYDYPSDPADTGVGTDGHPPSDPADTNDPLNAPSNNTASENTPLPDTLPLEWQILSGGKVTLPDQKVAQQKDACMLVAMGTGSFQQRIYDLCFAFQQARDIVLIPDDAKGNRKAAKSMVTAGVQPHHVVDAVRELLSKGMTVVNMFSVQKTAISFANPAPTAKKKSGFISPKPGL